jgi:hypothetical protein
MAINTIKGSAVASCARTAATSVFRNANAIKPIETSAFSATTASRGMPGFSRQGPAGRCPELT